eukprot:TRINITY_DN13032_c0_g1_i2.p1 TRINITY_DN13032_c0_g1~~TRINITY_DN13032_c0_g1_i2.p1  ORF type:complete len:459 (-),score=86.71 TRINITY_DN13032_c0_g1_i2:373-1749(-)
MSCLVRVLILNEFLLFGFSFCLQSVTLNELVPQVTLSVNSWVGSALNVNVAKILLEEVIGIPTALVEADEYAQWNKLASGDIHACLEVWPSGHQQDIKNFIGNKTVVGSGPLGVLGQIGWYTFQWVVDLYPQLASSTSLSHEENCKIFGNTFYSGDPTWVEFDSEIIQTYGYCLNSSIHFLGSEEALVEFIVESYTNSQPILFYFWSPHGLLYQIPLVRINLPKLVERTQYPPDILLKVSWSGLRQYSPSAGFLVDTFTYTTNDQISMLGAHLFLNKTVEEAACEWVQNHSLIWKNWILPMLDKPEYVSFDEVSGIVILVVTATCQFYVLVLISLLCIYRNHPYIKANSFVYMVTTLLGGMVMVSSSYWILGYANQVNCIGAIVMGGVGYSLLFGLFNCCEGIQDLQIISQNQRDQGGSHNQFTPLPASLPDPWYRGTHHRPLVNHQTFQHTLWELSL